jgi:nicotinate-nucleotide adenylyltransferase
MTKIALFGTSADPPTAGHQTILKWLSDNYDWVGVWAADNPFKEHQTSLTNRLDMLQLLMEDIKPKRNNIKVDKRLSHRRSLISVQEAQKIWGYDAEYSLVIGSDLITQIRHWYRVEDLLKQVKLLVIPRPGYNLEKSDLEALQSLGGEYEIAHLNTPGISSTAYRVEGDSRVIIQPVKDYIEQNKLYL